MGRRELVEEGVAGRKGWYGLANRRTSKHKRGGPAITASRWPLRARRSEAAAGHRISKPHPASTYRYEPVSY